MAITLFVLITVFLVEYFPNLRIFPFLNKEIEEQNVQEVTNKRSLQKDLIIRSLDDVIENKIKKTKSIVIDSGKENQMWVYLGKEKCNVLPKSSGMLNIRMLESVSGMLNSQTLDDAVDSSDEDESIATEDYSCDSETLEGIELSGEEENSNDLFNNT